MLSGYLCMNPYRHELSASRLWSSALAFSVLCFKQASNATPISCSLIPGRATSFFAELQAFVGFSPRFSNTAVLRMSSQACFSGLLYAEVTRGSRPASLQASSISLAFSPFLSIRWPSSSSTSSGHLLPKQIAIVMSSSPYC